ncbi:hypothetical protein Ancab_000508 [Ancistrocladus abbreviatus]
MMSNSDKPTSLVPSPAAASVPAGGVDPLLKDLSEKKQSFRRNVVSLAAELKEVRGRLSLKEQSFAKETLTRQEAEAKAKNMEKEICRLQKSLDERNGQIQASASVAEKYEAVSTDLQSYLITCPENDSFLREIYVKYLKELDDLRSQLTVTQATADASAASAQCAQIQCLALLKELDEKNNSLKEHEERVQRLAEQLDSLQEDLQAREFSQKQLKDEVVRVERDIMEAVAKAGSTKDCELRKLLDEMSPKNLDNVNRLLAAKDEEICKLKDEIRVLSAHWKLKTKEMESQFEKHRRADQELKKRVLKLEFCLQEARSQTRKLQRMGDRRDKAIQELRDQLATKQQGAAKCGEKQNFWESSSFKILVSMSMVVLVVFSKR